MLSISIDNFASGFAGSALVAYMSGLTAPGFAATQYALLSSLYALPGKLIGGTSGAVVDAYGYPVLFTATAAIGIPLVILCFVVRRDTMKTEHERDAADAAPPVRSAVTRLKKSNPAAIHQIGLRGHGAGIVGAEEQRQVGDILAARDLRLMHWRLISSSSLSGVSQRSIWRWVMIQPGTMAVDADVLRPEFARQRARQADERPISRSCRPRTNRRSRDSSSTPC